MYKYKNIKNNTLSIDSTPIRNYVPSYRVIKLYTSVLKLNKINFNNSLLILQSNIHIEDENKFKLYKIVAYDHESTLHIVKKNNNIYIMEWSECE